ncbi:MAG TPA: hypothetical protein VFW11_05330 [Cyclobacteriaceae bacterium]|nr:hypothetical protein [Cyclobacteriaceae bacterium]
MKHLKLWTMGLFLTGSFLVLAFTSQKENKPETDRRTHWERPKGCVFRTLFGEESSDSAFIYKTPESVVAAVTNGEAWLANAQQENGGWGAGSHLRQQVMDPHAVPADPATTSMVAMALLRSGNTLKSGPYSRQLENALNYLLRQVESTPDNATNITSETGTQIQTKLGGNIDVILTAQFLTTILDHLDDKPSLKERTKRSLDICIDKIQRAQNADGSIRGDGWAGVLQSSLANNALEMAQARGAKVDKDALERSRNFQKGNYNTKTGDVITGRAAGVVLYSVSGSTRASAKEARRVKEAMDEAKRKGILDDNAPASAENLQEIGFSESESEKYATAYEVYQSAKVTAQRNDVMDGFGSNGGEEFLSYLQTGESMVINKDTEWKQWYDNISGRMIKIQNEDGSWNGHHCITSPVFCTATSLLILSINNDIEKLTRLGKE